MFHRRTLSSALSGPVSRNKIRLVFGARQVGKTELLRHVVDPKQTLLLDLGPARDRRRYEADPDAFRRMVLALPERIQNVVVDEIQKVPSLLDEVQGLHGADRTRWQFFLTGSSARRLRSESANLLPGRSHVYRLYPVSRWEKEGPDRVDWPAASPPGRHASADPLFPAQELGRTLVTGSLPGVRAEPTDTAAATLEAYVENYLEEEIRREAVVRDLGAFSTFLRLAALESGQQTNLAALSQESGIAASTLKGFYGVLVDTFVGYWIRAYGRQGRKRLLVTPRFLLFDTGVRNAAAGLPIEESILGSEGPRLLEQWVGLELICRAGILGRGHDVSFWRTASGAEVDWVWESPAEDIPVEVKWTARPAPKDARHLETFLDEHPRRARRGFLVCRCARPERVSERVLAVPWDRF
ncbi:MAG: ATP-binding protein [Deltaproteobacteria bacterium]|nr:ATP-binding protein [Deltaproteobacteria bacterium]